jgi:uncharacterized protein (TIGR03083 family)
LTLADDPAIILIVFGIPNRRREMVMAEMTAVGAGLAAPLGHHEAMTLAATEFDRMVAQLRALAPDDWARPTACALWDVRATAAHVLGMAEAQASFRQFAHDFRAAGKRSGGKMIDEMSATQVRERAAMTPAAIISRLAAVAPRAVRARRRTPAPMRWAIRIKNDPPFDAERWRYGYLVDTIFTRDTWMHRLDISRATGRPMELTGGHDGRLIADIVAEWGRRHGQPFTLTLTGPAGGRWQAGDGGETLALDALDFCWILSGRRDGTGLPATGLLATVVPF